MSGADRRRQPLERIYGPLGDHLAARAAAGERRVALTFREIEEAILGHPLPISARSPRLYRAWWGGSNAHYPHRWHGWVRHGWQVAAVDPAAEAVTFARPGGEEEAESECR